MGSSLKRKHHRRRHRQKQHHQHQRTKTKKRSSFSSMTTNTSKARSLLQQCAKVINYMVSFHECAPFMLSQTPPPPKSKIKRPMDFTTLERRLYSQQYYTSYSEFTLDLVLIWQNALTMHKDTNHPMHKNAKALQQYYEE